MQLDESPVEEQEERRITMLMVAGGHFAGMVVGLRPRGKGEKQEVKGAGDVRIIHHKTFHRYTSESKRIFSLFARRADEKLERSKEARRG